MQLWRCPHCAYQAAAEQFVSQESVSLAKRREGHRFGPVTQAQPSLNPNAWHIHTFQPITPERSSGVPQKPEALPSYTSVPQPPERDWVAAQAYVESRTAPLRHVFEPAPTPAVPSPPPEPRILTTSSDWSPMKPGQLPKLTPWPGLAAEIAGDVTPPHLRGRARRFWLALLCLMIVGSAAVAMILTDRQRNDQVSRLTKDLALAKASTATRQPTQALPPFPAALPRVLPPESKLGLKETENLAEALMQSLLAATDDESRLACIALPEQHRENLHTFFATQPGPIQLLGFRALPAAVAVMPGKYPVTLCEVRSSLPGKATAITRLVSTPDGGFRLDWPLLRDSLGNKLSTYAARPGCAPQWQVVGLKRNFGFNLPPGIRATHHVFDVQGSGNGIDRTLAVLPKNSPTGRAFDNALAWSDLYIVRTLLHWTEIDSRPVLIILDGELTTQE